MNDTSTQPTEPSGGSSLPWSWTRIPRLTSEDVVVQVDEDGCGPACGSMLLKDRGILVCQTIIAEAITLPVDGPALANRLSALSNYRWMGGALDFDRDPGWAAVARITELRGSWAALLEPHGPRHVGHWVVIDGVSDEGVVLIRDPVGQAYGTPIEEFLSLWRYTVLVIEEEP